MTALEINPYDIIHHFAAWQPLLLRPVFGLLLLVVHQQRRQHRLPFMWRSSHNACCLKPGVHKVSKNLGTGSKLYVLERWHEASSIPRTREYSATVENLVALATLSPCSKPLYNAGFTNSRPHGTTINYKCSLLRQPNQHTTQTARWMRQFQLPDSKFFSCYNIQAGS
jgi:hypothetical protein